MKRDPAFCTGVVISCLLFLVCSGWVQAAEPYKIGAAFAITGPAAWLGEPERNTAQMLLKMALEKAGPDSEKIRSALETIKGYVGIGGIFNYSPEDHNGLTKEATSMLTVKDGKFVVAP